MPSFANLKIESENPLDDVWKNSSASQLMKDMITQYRSRAAIILKVEIPEHVLKFQSMIAEENNEGSVLWKGHKDQGDFVSPTMIRKDEVVVGAQEMRNKKGENGNMNGHNIFEMNNNGEVDGKDVKDVKDGEGVQRGEQWLDFVPENKIQSQIVDLVTPEFRKMHEFMADLKTWLDLEIPLIEDGNSFGAEVQQHLIREVVEASKRAMGFANGTRGHHTDRAKFVEDWLKFSNSKDIAMAIAESDKFDNHLVHSYLRQSVMVYAGLMTKFERNWEKVINPKGKNGNVTGGMY